MQLKLFHKLLLVLVGTRLCSVLLFAGFAHWYSSRSLVRYLIEVLLPDWPVSHAGYGIGYRLKIDSSPRRPRAALGCFPRPA